MKKTTKTLLTLLVATTLTACGSTPTKIDVKAITNDFVNGKDLYVFHILNNGGGRAHIIPKKAEPNFETGFWNIETKTSNILIPVDEVFVVQILDGMTIEEASLFCPVCGAELGKIRERAK